MSVKSSARIKKRRSAEATTTTFAGVNSTGGSQRVAATSGSNLSNQPPIPASSSISTPSSVSKRSSVMTRNPNFDTDETKLLIQLWGDPKLQRTLITTHKKHAVICQLAAKMQEYGYHRSPEEITTRIKNLKCFYNRLKKDMECGLAGESEPSWKHFAEMDAIMTRPIFSVRPNEVPAPSLKYQLEQAMEEHAERRKRRLENGDELSESDNEEDDMVLSTLVPKVNGKAAPGAGTTKDSACLMPDVDVEMDISEETFAAITNAATTDKNSSKQRKLSSCAGSDVDIGDSPKQSIKTEQEKDASSNLAASATATVADEDDDCLLLTLPKEEPIDVDAVEEKTDSSNCSSTAQTVMPTLTDMLQLPKTSNLLPFSGANVIIPGNSITTSAPATSNNTISTNSSATNAKLSPGKISLVPTNFLMQPKLPAPPCVSAVTAANVAKAPQLQILQSAINQGARLMISGGPPAPSQASNTGIVATGPGGVKVFLVNADQANAKTTSGVSRPATILPLPPGNLPPQQLPQQHLQQQQLQPQNKVQQQEQEQLQMERKEEKRRAQEKIREEQQSKRHMTNMRILLRQLLNAQNEANEIQHNRLSLERERLDWEKSIGDRLLTLLPTLLQPAAPATASPSAPATSLQSQQYIVSAAPSTAQRLQPPKLLFTTALPMTNGTVSMPHILTSSNALTASLPKVIAAPTTTSGTSNTIVPPKPTDINDVQLVTPKVERDG